MKPFEKLRYKVCPIFDECTKHESYNAANCTECPLNPAVTNAGFVKLKLKSLILYFRLLFFHISLRYPIFSIFFRMLVQNVLIPFLLGMIFVRLFFK